MGKLILVRHGESQWNKRAVFTGWVDVSLTGQGIEEVQLLAKKMKDIKFDVMFTSRLERAQATLLMIAAEQEKTAIFVHEDEKYDISFEGCNYVPVFSHQSLNERHYGSLQGMKKDEARKKFGEEQVHQWRRFYDVRPPEGESLKDVGERVTLYFREKIKPLLNDNKNVLISAHGNSLRALIKCIDNISDNDIANLELAPGDMISYTAKDGQLINDQGGHAFTRPLVWK